MRVGERKSWKLKPWMYTYGPFYIWEDCQDDWYIEMQQCAEQGQYAWLAKLYHELAHADEDWALESPQHAREWIDARIREKEGRTDEQSSKT